VQSFLIQPVQRIPRYRLLLQDIVKRTPEDHIDYKNLSFALTTILDVAQLVNDRKKESEAQSMLKELNDRLKSLSSIVIQPHRKIIRKGVFQTSFYDFTIDGRNLKSVIATRELYFCYLFNDLLVLMPKVASDKETIFCFYLAFVDMQITQSENEGETIVEMITVKQGKKLLGKLEVENNTENKAFLDALNEYLEQTRKQMCTKMGLDDFSKWEHLHLKRIEIVSAMPLDNESLDQIKKRKDGMDKNITDMKSKIDADKQKVEELLKAIQEKEKNLLLFSKLHAKYCETEESLTKKVRQGKHWYSSLY